MPQESRSSSFFWEIHFWREGGLLYVKMSIGTLFQKVSGLSFDFGKQFPRIKTNKHKYQPSCFWCFICSSSLSNFLKMAANLSILCFGTRASAFSQIALYLDRRNFFSLAFSDSTFNMNILHIKIWHTNKTDFILNLWENNKFNIKFTGRL